MAALLTCCCWADTTWAALKASAHILKMLDIISSVHLTVKVIASAIQITEHEGDQPAGPHNGDISGRAHLTTRWPRSFTSCRSGEAVNKRQEPYKARDAIARPSAGSDGIKPQTIKCTSYAAPFTLCSYSVAQQLSSDHSTYGNFLACLVSTYVPADARLPSVVCYLGLFGVARGLARHLRVETWPPGDLRQASPAYASRWGNFWECESTSQTQEASRPQRETRIGCCVC